MKEKRTIKIFKSFEEQEAYFLEYFMLLTPSERLQALAELQKKNYKDFGKSSYKKITIQKYYFANGHWTSGIHSFFKMCKKNNLEHGMIIHPIGEEVEIKMVPYEVLKDIKLHSVRPKDLWDVARLNELRNKK